MRLQLAGLIDNDGTIAAGPDGNVDLSGQRIHQGEPGRLSHPAGDSPARRSPSAKAGFGGIAQST
jgi:hypothetical protein